MIIFHIIDIIRVRFINHSDTICRYHLKHIVSNSVARSFFTHANCCNTSIKFKGVCTIAVSTTPSSHGYAPRWLLRLGLPEQAMGWMPLAQVRFGIGSMQKIKLLSFMHVLVDN